jgi:hypothetical protein
MPEQNSIVFRGRCGIDLSMFKDEETSRIYTADGCPNNAIAKGTSPNTLRKVCADCKLEMPSASSTPVKGVAQKENTMTMPPPTNVPPPASSVVAPAVEVAPVTATVAVPVAPAAPVAPTAPVSIPAPTAALPVAAVQPPMAAAPVAPIPVAPVVLTSDGDLVALHSAVAAPVVATQTTPPPPVVTVPVVPALPAVVAPPPGSTVAAPLPETSFLPGMNLSGVNDEADLDIDTILDSIEGMAGGPSTGGLSWHNIADAQACWRKAYYSMVLGLQKNMRSTALSLGSLVHACFEMHYKSGGARTFEPCDKVAAAGGVNLAAEARRLVYAQLQKYGQEEASTWDIRGVELQGTWFMPPTKIGNRKIHIPLTCRHDLLTALRQPGAPCTPWDEQPASGCYIVDHKTASAMTWALTKGYGMDGQFLLNALIYSRAEAEQFGHLAGVIVSIIAKHKTLDPQKSFTRIFTTADEASLAEFYKDEIRPWTIELYTRLADQEYRKDMYKWPKCRSSCIGTYGPCFFFDICDTTPGKEDSIMASMFSVDETRQKHVETFREPSAEHKRMAGKTTEQVTAEQGKKASAKEQRDGAKNASLATLKTGLEQYPAFKAETYLTDGAVKKKDVIQDLATELQAAWEAGTKFELPCEGFDLPIAFGVSTKGFSWKAGPRRGSWTFRSMATELCKDWWDAARLTPMAAAPEETVVPTNIVMDAPPVPPATEPVAEAEEVLVKPDTAPATTPVTVLPVDVKPPAAS